LWNLAGWLSRRQVRVQEPAPRPDRACDRDGRGGAVRILRLSVGELVRGPPAVDRPDRLQFTLLRPDLFGRAGSRPAAHAGDRRGDGAVLSEPHRPGARPAVLRHAVGPSATCLWRGKRTLRPLRRGLSRPGAGVLLLALQLAPR